MASCVFHVYIYCFANPSPLLNLYVNLSSHIFLCGVLSMFLDPIEDEFKAGDGVFCSTLYAAGDVDAIIAS